MKHSLLYFSIYLFLFLLLVKPFEVLQQVSGFYSGMLVVFWIAVSAAIVHVIHFWPKKS